MKKKTPPGQLKKRTKHKTSSPSVPSLVKEVRTL